MVAACAPSSRAPSHSELGLADGPLPSVVVVVLEPGMCFGCSAPPKRLEELRRCAPTHVRYFWRRPPNDREARAAAPLRLPMAGVLRRPWPKEAPQGARLLLYEEGALVASDSSVDPLSTYSLLERAFRNERANCAPGSAS